MSLETRVAALEAALNAIVTKMEDDVANNSGAMTTGYDASLVEAGKQYTVTNQKAYGVRLVDLSGKEFFLGRAGSASEAATVSGLSSEILALEADGVVVTAAV